MSGSARSLLVCPVTKQHLLPVVGDALGRLETAMEEGALRYVDGTLLDASRNRVTFLITENGHHLYTVVDEFPVLLESRQVDSGSLDISSGRSPGQT